MRCIAVQIALAFLPFITFGQNFVKTTDQLQKSYFGNVKWADLDNDGDLDLIYSGVEGSSDNTFVYENVNGAFTLHPTNLPHCYGYFDLGDYDNDGDLDVLITGSLTTGGIITRIFKNNGGFDFVEAYTFPPGIYYGNVNWVDIDNDNDLDFVIVGFAQPDPLVLLNLYYENTGNGFTAFDLNLPKVPYCKPTWVDIVGDGYVDLIIATRSSGFPEIFQISIYQNNGDKTIEKKIDVGNSIFPSTIEPGDFDNDGDKDLLITGRTALFAAKTVLFENKGDSFTERTDIHFPGFGGASGFFYNAQWVDFDYDGNLDIVFSGKNENQAATEGATRFYKNNGPGTFVEVTETAFDNAYAHSFDIADIDNDGDLDIVRIGEVSNIFKNISVSTTMAANNKPGSPDVAGFKEKINGKQVWLSWGDGSDTETPLNGLSYNYMLRNDQKKLVVPDSDPVTGYLKSFNPYHAFAKKVWINNVPEGQLYYSVQSVDNAKAASVFSSEKSFFVIYRPRNTQAKILDANSAKITWQDNSAIETAYSIDRLTGVAEDFSEIASLDPDVVTYTDVDLETDTYYYYRVRAVNASASAYDSVSLIIPTPPDDFQGTPINSSTISLTWTDNSAYETAYVIELKESIASAFETLATLPPNTTSYDAENLLPGRQYDIKVSAQSPNGQTEATVTVAMVNLPPTGEDFTVNGTEDTALEFSTSIFNSHFHDEDGNDIVRIKMLDIHTGTALKINGVLVINGQVLMASDMDHLTFTPLPEESGDFTFTFYVGDGIEFSADSYTATIQIEPVDDAPVVEPIVDVQVDLGNAVPEFEVKVTDVDNTLAQLAISVTSQNAAVLKQSGIALTSVSPDHVRVKLTPEALAGTSLLTFTAGDGTLQTSQQFTLTILPVLGLDESSSDAVLYPNPFTNELTVNIGLMSSPAALTITDLVGRGIYAAAMEDGEHKVDMSSVASGVYVVKIEVKDGVVMQRKVLKK